MSKDNGCHFYKNLSNVGKHNNNNQILVNRSPCATCRGCRVDRFQVVVHDEAYDVDGLDEEVSDGNLTLRVVKPGCL